ncbi:copper resistance protein CopC [Nocardia higoensis]|uniref:Copper resistance protein CopC n=1 Tax=Nocardia higoensis TaxID=228599 RepID=A0ABS0DJG3_9NOCA|nr:copper resistance CopC family protein [Nocardia higoensis]MBF6356818.1 copper resistance protein CopC [Nocardia higoensis]
MPKHLTRALITALLALGMALTASGVATAHSGAVGSVPEDGARIDAGPERVVVMFNEELQPGFPSLTLVGPDGNLWSKGEPTIEGKSVSVAAGELGPAGEYTIAFRVTSADGHVVSGTRTFTLTTPGQGVPGERADGKSADAAEEDSGFPLWLLIVGVVVLLGVGLAVVLFGFRGRDNRA